MFNVEINIRGFSMSLLETLEPNDPDVQNLMDENDNRGSVMVKPVAVCCAIHLTPLVAS